MAEDNVIINETPELQGIAKQLKDIAGSLEETIQTAIQRGYNFAANTLFGARGEVTIEKNTENNDWSKAETGGVAFTIEFPEKIGDNDMIIFSPKTAKDRTEINYAELFVSPDVNDSRVCISCANEPRATITLVYFIIRGGGTAIPDSSTSDNQGNSNGDSDETRVEVPIEED